MAYEPPSGWLERRDETAEENWEGGLRAQFHTRPDCERVKRPESLVQVDRPYSATRCRACAPD